MSHAPAPRRWQVFIDRGGTFTDLVAISHDGRRQTAKLLSDAPEAYADAALAGIARLIPQSDRLTHVRMGTTVATNALLERQGQPTLLLITQGLRDLLQIGYQTRPDLFALHIQPQVPLYQQVIEVPERLAATGQTLRPLDLQALTPALKDARQSGLSSVAIALLFGYKYPAHEQRLRDLCLQLGFEHVSTSHEVSPTIKLVPRGDTTVVDAYLTPLLHRYTARLTRALPGVPITFMQSNGGLATPAAFRGRDAILSGPAGGVIGASKTAQAAGFDRVIGFDMGGTSTDVCHVAKDRGLERVYHAEIAGIRLAAPMLAIHTVAAGGGSICHFDGHAFRVGPDSAGANPGPMAYRRGGPLTVTDCNLMLGKLPPQHFPALFGPNSDQRLDLDTVRDAFGALSQRVGQPPEAIAEGFLDVAIQTMARAIKRVSTDQGHDLRGYTLAAFGGAGGQHACRVAQALDIQTVFLHPDAGVLSAWGMGLADQRAIRQGPVESPLTPAGLSQARQRLDTLAPTARAALDAAPNPAIRLDQRLHLRYAGSDTTLALPITADDTAETLTTAFQTAHERRFGFFEPDRALHIAAATAEAVLPGAQPALASRPDPGRPTPIETVAVTTGGRTHATPVYRRQDLSPQHPISGPAIVLDGTGTTVIEPGWRGATTPSGALVLTHAPKPQATHSAATHAAPDPALLTVYNHRFMAIAEQMGLTLEHTATSVNIKERRDYSCALFDAQGRLVANAPHIPVHLGSMDQSVQAVLARFGATIAPGDAFAINDPYDGGTHLPDITVVSPVFVNQQLVFFVAARGHHADVGGLTPGSMPPHSRTLQDEGIRIPATRILRHGVLQLKRLTRLFAPARAPQQNLADLRAQLAALARGHRELSALVQSQGLDEVLAYTQHIRHAASLAVQDLLATLPQGAACCPLDDKVQIHVAIRVDRRACRATIDFTHTSPQSQTNINAPLAVTRAAVLYVLRTLAGRDLPLNAGCLDPITLIIPQGSILSPKAPAAVVAGNVETSQVICDALLGAVGALANSQGTMNNLSFGNDQHQYYETICGGAGAGPHFAGASAVHTHMTNSRLTDPELLETRYPVRLHRFGIRPHSGGPGQFRGGDGVIRELEFLEAMTVSLLSNRRETAPQGLQGGLPGLPGQATLIRRDGRREPLGHRAQVEVQPGDRLCIQTPAGGGFGPPRPSQSPDQAS